MLRALIQGKIVKSLSRLGEEAPATLCDHSSPLRVMALMSLQQLQLRFLELTSEEGGQSDGEDAEALSRTDSTKLLSQGAKETSLLPENSKLLTSENAKFLSPRDTDSSLSESAKPRRGTSPTTTTTDEQIVEELADAIDRTTVSLISSPQPEAASFGCRSLARLALRGRRRRMLEQRGTEAALCVVKNYRKSLPLLHDALVALVDLSADPHNQVSRCR